MDQEAADRYISDWFNKLQIEEYNAEILSYLNPDDSNQNLTLSEVILEATCDLQNQRVIRVDCERTCKDVGEIFNNQGNLIQKILTFYCKWRKLDYKQGLNDVLAPFLYLVLHSSIYAENSNQHIPFVFLLFSRFIDLFLPKVFEDKEFIALQSMLRIFQLIVQYHDPQLENFLDSNQVPPELYAGSWLITLFSRTCNYQTLFFLWDTYITNLHNTTHAQNLPLFNAVVILIKNRDKILKTQQEDLPLVMSQMLTRKLSNDLGMVNEFVVSYNSIPKLTRISNHLFEITPKHITELLCKNITSKMPPEADSLTVLENFASCVSSVDDLLDKKKKLIVDSRTVLEYKTARIIGSVHFDASSQLFASSFQGLLEKIENVSKDELLTNSFIQVVIFGRNVKKIVSRLIIQNTQYVSYVINSFDEILDRIKETGREGMIEYGEAEEEATSPFSSEVAKPLTNLLAKLEPPKIEKQEEIWLSLNDSPEFHDMNYFVAEYILNSRMETERCVLGVADADIFHLIRHPKEFHLAKIIDKFPIKDIVKISSRRSRQDVMILNILPEDQSFDDGWKNIVKKGYIVKRAKECLDLVKEKHTNLERSVFPSPT